MTRIRIAIVFVAITMLASIARIAKAAKCIDQIGANTVQARTRLALIDVDFASWSRIAGHTNTAITAAFVQTGAFVEARR